MTDQRVTLEIDDHVAHVRLNRPEKMNAVDGAMFAALLEAGDALKRAAGVRAVVLSGNGRGFCAGIDLGNLASGGKIDLESLDEAGMTAPQRCVMQWRALPAPVIASVHGVAFGAGLQIALGADIRIARPDAKLAFMEAKWGLVPDMAGVYLAERLLRGDVAADLIYSGRAVTGAEALGLGLVTRLSEEPLGEAMRLARELAGNSPDAVRTAKRILNAAAGAAPREVFLAESTNQRRLLKSANHREAVRARLQQETPHFTESED
jgi:enoyl-CoA hydratase/carnithine racemase